MYVLTGVPVPMKLYTAKNSIFSWFATAKTETFHTFFGRRADACFTIFPVYGHNKMQIYNVDLTIFSERTNQTSSVRFKKIYIERNDCSPAGADGMWQNVPRSLSFLILGRRKNQISKYVLARSCWTNLFGWYLERTKIVLTTVQSNITVGNFRNCFAYLAVALVIYLFVCYKVVNRVVPLLNWVGQIYLYTLSYLDAFQSR